IIADERSRIVGMGFNGGPSGWKHCNEGGCPRLQNDSAPGSNYDDCIACHAEQNAIINSIGDGETIYVNGPPCFTCAKMIVNTTCKRVVHLCDPSYVYESDKAVLDLFYNCGIKQYALKMEDLNARIKA